MGKVNKKKRYGCRMKNEREEERTHEARGYNEQKKREGSTGGQKQG
jgi:hypothetical protein